MLLIVDLDARTLPTLESITLGEKGERGRCVCVGGVFRAYTINPRSAERGRKEGDGGNFAECKI